VKLTWQIDRSDVKRVNAFFGRYSDHPFVSERRKTNLGKQKPKASKEYVWQVMVSCLLTTQQRVSPGSAVDRFVNSPPFLLSYQTCRAQANVGGYCLKVLQGFGGLRRSSIIAAEIDANLGSLERGGWADLFQQFDSIPRPQTASAERQAADFVDDLLKGFGPKQSRNFLQWIGLTQFEIPIDSRIVKWLNGFGFPVWLAPAALADRYYYHFILDGFQQLCERSKVPPCLLDAAIFVNADEGG
jgi:hypothetical protein